MISVLVMTSDKYLKALKPFTWLFNTYWSAFQEVTIAGFTPPDFELPPNFHFISLGAFSDYPIGKWSDALLKALDVTGFETFVLMLEDYWLCRGVDHEAVRMCDDYARQFKSVLRIDLTVDRLFAYGPRYPQDVPHYGNLGYLDLIKSEIDKPYHMSLMTAIWRTDNLRRVIRPGQTPWQIEIDDTPVAAKMDDLLVLGTRQWPIKHVLAYRGGNIDTGADLSGLQPEDAAYIEAQGWN
jgi:hypothetical protein